MNLLNFQNRFKPSTFIPIDVSQVTGYTMALTDLLKYLEQLTEFDPAKRYIDSVDILDAITETNTALTNIAFQAEKELQEAFNDLAGVNLGGDKVNAFLKSNLGPIDEEIEQEFKDANDLKGLNI